MRDAHATSYDSPGGTFRHLINRPTAALRTAGASLPIRVQRVLVIHGDLFTRFDIAQCDEQDVTIENLHKAVRIAGMIYVMSSVSADTSVKTPPRVDGADSEDIAPGTPKGFGV